MVRFFDIVLSLTGLIFLSPVILLIYLVSVFDTGSPLFIQERLGRKQTTFKLIKFRSMTIDTPQVGTHLAKKGDVTTLGAFLRKTKLDELPQLLNVLIGQMSLIGPRPGLITQIDLSHERAKRGVFDVKPGISGLSQIKKIDMSTPKKLSIYDKVMIDNMNICFYFQMIIATVIGKGSGDRIKE